ncbi:MAG: 2-amino-4-hydroxy-6-hydroxymethyldihydropteridine diphosphokinase [Chloroflexota bacterium]|nr:2-amino-4-hydroxy-6-hydroxymethyldihydropteridine diphosphokinase [Chloroflexota bacterium]
MPQRVFLGLGANVGNRIENLRLALRWLEPQCRVVAVSSLYQSAALVLEGSPAGPDYYNGAVEVQTELSPAELLFHVKQIEHDIGRRPAERWAPRPIDIDILLYGDAVIDTPELQIPHPSLTARNFVMAPLAELAGDVVHPVLGKPIGALAEDVDYVGLSLIAERGWATGTGQPPEESGEKASPRPS